MYIENLEIEGLPVSAKNSLVLDGDYIPKLFAVPDRPDQLDLMFESLDERVVIPLFVKNRESAIDLIVKFFEELHEEFIDGDDSWSTL